MSDGQEVASRAFAATTESKAPPCAYFPVPLHVGQATFRFPPQLWQVWPLTLPDPLHTGQVIVLKPWHVLQLILFSSLSVTRDRASAVSPNGDDLMTGMVARQGHSAVAYRVMQ